MQPTVPDILARIARHKQTELGQIIARREELENRAAERIAERRDFTHALDSASPAVIAEIKQASPSKGVLTRWFDPASIAAAYESGGAAALSVLTDAEFFKGSLADLDTARAATGNLPALRKDFTIDEVQIVEAAAHGADAILLIAALHTASSLRDLRESAAAWGLAALVEVHDEEELAAAIDSGAVIIGVNNRNLRTFEVTLETSLALAERMPSNVLAVSESGIRTHADVVRLMDAGYHAFLVGEQLMTAPDPAAALRDLIGPQG
jgi:indole-3-glycerol phosphate synthase